MCPERSEEIPWQRSTCGFGRNDCEDAFAIYYSKDHHKKYEYGIKASIVKTKNSGIIIGVASHEKNEHDSKTPEAALLSANKYRTKPIKEAICDRGYRGKKEVDGTQKKTGLVCLPTITTSQNRKKEWERT